MIPRKKDILSKQPKVIQHAFNTEHNMFQNNVPKLSTNILLLVDPLQAPSFKGALSFMNAPWNVLGIRRRHQYFSTIGNLIIEAQKNNQTSIAIIPPLSPGPVALGQITPTINPDDYKHDLIWTEMRTRSLYSWEKKLHVTFGEINNFLLYSIDSNFLVGKNTKQIISAFKKVHTINIVGATMPECIVGVLADLEEIAHTNKQTFNICLHVDGIIRKFGFGCKEKITPRLVQNITNLSELDITREPNTIKFKLPS